MRPMATLNGGLGLGPSADVDFGIRMNSLEQKLDALKSTGVLHKGSLGRVVSSAAQLRSYTAASLEQERQIIENERISPKQLAREAQCSALESRLLASSKTLSKEGDSLRGAAMVRETAAAAANAAATVLKIESAGPMALRAAVAAEACAAAELAASQYSRSPAPASPLRSRVQPVVEEKSKYTLLDAGMRPMGPWWVPETSTRAQSTSPVRAPNRDASPTSASFSKRDAAPSSPGPAYARSASAREIAISPYHRSIAGEVALAPSPVQSLQNALAAENFGLNKPSAKSIFQKKSDESTESNAVDFYLRRSQLITARSEVDKLTKQLDAARADVKRLQDQQARDKKERKEVKMIDRETAKDLKTADRAAVAHLHSQHHEYTQIIGHVPHSGVDMASKIMKDSFARIEKTVADDKLVPGVAQREANNVEVDYMRSRAVDGPSRSIGGSSLRKAEAGVRSGATTLLAKGVNDFGSRRDDSNAPWRQFQPNAAPATHSRRLFG